MAGSLKPDAHPGIDLPIGGVLATENSVIPHAVGVDIVRAMKFTVYDCKPTIIPGQRDRCANIFEIETRIGIGAGFKNMRDHDVMDGDWPVSLAKQHGVDLICSDLDVVPGVKKGFHTVMAACADRVEVLAHFDTKLVNMSPPGELAANGSIQ